MEEATKGGCASEIDAYIDACPPLLQPRLRELRKAIAEAAPNAIEKMSYRMPTFYLEGNLVHFAAHAHHIGFYPLPETIESFLDELEDFQRSKGAVQFPHDKPLPLDLVRRMVKFRVEENLKKAALKKRKRPGA